MPRLALPGLIAAALLAAPFAAAADPDPKSLAVPAAADREARELVGKLGAASYAEREQATRELRDMGRLALPALRDGEAGTAVPEVPMRCHMLMARAVADDTKARVDCFLADADGKYRHDLPAGEAFFAAAGTSEAARTLFRDLLLAPDSRELLAAVGGPPDDAARLVAARRAELVPHAGAVVITSTGKGPLAPQPLDVAAVLVVEAAIPDRGAVGTGKGAVAVGVNSPTYLFTQPVFRAALADGPYKEPLNGLLAKWIDTRTERASLFAAVGLGTTLQSKVSLAAARKLLAAKDGAPRERAVATAYVGRFGATSDLDALAPLLADDAQVSTVAVVGGGAGGVRRSPLQLRDVALAMSLLLAKQDPTAYGMRSRYANVAGVTADTMKYSYLNFHFDNTDEKADDLRAAAHKKWDDWKTAEAKKGQK